jgi:16S rRNA (uracil1498-N3)-methyltransferase
MRRRFIADEFSSDRAALTGAHAAHLARVLRARVGQEFDVAVEGVVRLGRVVSVSDDRVEFALREHVSAGALPEINVALAIFKFDRFEWAVEKLTELGVARIIPVVAQRTEQNLAKAAQKRVERWRRLALAASEQSRRASPPEILQAIRLRDLLSFVADQRILLAERSLDRTTLPLLTRAINQCRGSLVLAIGPEGGWSDDELREFSHGGWTATSLGPTILRAETAAIAATAIAVAALTESLTAKDAETAEEHEN